jgi:hypothetical protein
MKVESSPNTAELTQVPQPHDVAERGEGLFDRRLDAVLARAEYLLTHGAFHIKLHFSGEQMTCWWFNDPLRYQVYRGEEALSEQVLESCSDGEIMGLEIGDEQVCEILRGYGQLRRLQGANHLRSASLNRVNGMLGLSFSCDRIHYLPHLEYPDFLASLGIAS